MCFQIWVNKEENEMLKVDTIVQSTILTKNNYEILIDWMYEVYVHYKFDAYCLSFALTLMHQYIDVIDAKKIPKNKFQEIAITCIFIATKFTQVQFLPIEECSYITDYSVQISQIVSREQEILKSTEFNVNYINPLTFFQFFEKLFIEEDKKNKVMLYVLRTYYDDLVIRTYPPSVIMTACVFLTFDAKVCENNENINVLSINLRILKECTELITKLCC